MHILLLTDMPDRAERLARSLCLAGQSRIVDVLDPDQARIRLDPASVRAIVSDVSFARSECIAGLRRHLDAFRADRRPYLCLLQEDTPRGRAQATALRADRVLPAGQAAQMLPAALASLTAPEAAIAPALTAHVASADAALGRMFALGRAGSAIEPDLIAAGAAFIETALRQTDLRAWLELVWQFDDATHQHCLLVAGLAAAFGRQLGLSQADCQRLTEAALLHDVGKSRIPIALLNKAGPLDEAERATVERHALLGYEMLRGHGYSDPLLAVVRSHHEYLDGTGYPDGLRGNAIPDLVRLVTICDIYGALIERRPYRTPMGGEAAYAVLTGLGGKLDQDLVNAFRPIAAAVRAPVRAAG
ncbi:HD-GYP domain-containing protein [Methylobacterium nigriterrae]|uniref:HD-GYP domain-containing protein n=1 Tax=Methylobacterium nigriterrae TaxID=3127512 RepID=UPI003013C671